MKKWIAIWMIAMLLLMNGCNFKVQNETFSIQEEAVKTIEIQKEYTDENGQIYYRAKKIEDREQIEKICKMIQYMPVVRVPANTAVGIEKMTMIVILHAKIDHHLVLNGEYAFYDKMPYHYEKKGTLNEFVSFYDKLSCEEFDTEATPFSK